MTVLLLDNIGTQNPNLVGSMWNFLVDLVWGHFLGQTWFYLFVLVLVVVYFVASIFGKPDEFKNAHY